MKDEFELTTEKTDEIWSEWNRQIGKNVYGGFLLILKRPFNHTEASVFGNGTP